jgi:predicted enzyme related to lactoylglutathione lyase
MPRVVHFEIPIDNPDRATAFYRDAFGWEINAWGGPMDYWLATTGTAPDPGIDGALTRRTAETPGFGLALGVDDLATAVAKVRTAGGAVVRERDPIPGVGWLAAVTDTEGNTLSLMQDDPAAA